MRFFFADCVLDIASHSFSREGSAVPIEPQVFDLLHLLAVRGGKLVSKDDLVETVWEGRIVSDVTIGSRISAARKAVGDNGTDQKIIRTIPRRGFSLVAPVSSENVETRSSDITAKQTIRFAISQDGTQIAYAKSGKGPPLLRAGHFLTHLKKDWEGSVYQPTIAALSAQHSLVRYDQRGTGLSQVDIEDLSLQAYADDMLAVADAAGLDRFPIFATSQGVPVSIQFAATYPERVSKLVLFGGFAQGRTIRDDGSSRDDAEALMTLINKGWGKPDSAFMSAFVSLFCPDASREERASIAESQLASATPEMAARIRRTIDQFDVTDRLRRVQTPTLILHASGDAIHPLSQGRLLAGGIRGSEFKMIESNCHIILRSSSVWDEIVKATLEFIA
ncbi:MAG: alpha/beta fold hydrolase [Pseudomonadota bacterium]